MGPNAEVPVGRTIVSGLIGAAVLFAVAATVSSSVMVDRAYAGACANGCYARHAQCRIRTKGSPSCDRQLRRCLQRCIRRR